MKEADKKAWIVPGKIRVASVFFALIVAAVVTTAVVMAAIVTLLVSLAKIASCYGLADSQMIEFSGVSLQ